MGRGVVCALVAIRSWHLLVAFITIVIVRSLVHPLSPSSKPSRSCGCHYHPQLPVALIAPLSHTSTRHGML
ncbi:hypothetical protein V8E55_009256 [Tylopilus felleus]